MADVIAHATWLWRQLGYDVIREEDFDEHPARSAGLVKNALRVTKRADRDPDEPDLLPYEPYFGMKVIEMLNALPGGNPCGDRGSSRFVASQQAV